MEFAYGGKLSVSSPERPPPLPSGLTHLRSQVTTMMCPASLQQTPGMLLSQVCHAQPGLAHPARITAPQLPCRTPCLPVIDTIGACSGLPGKRGDRRDFHVLRRGKPDGDGNGVGVQGQRLPPAPAELQPLLRCNNHALVWSAPAILGELQAQKALCTQSCRSMLLGPASGSMLEDLHGVRMTGS